MAFFYPCYKRLMSNLGRIDAICGYATLAVDLLSEKLNEINDPRDWLSGCAKIRGMILHDVDEDLLPHRLAQMFVVSVHAQFEEFLQGFLDEHQSPGSNWPERKNGEPLCHYVLSQLGLLFRSECEQDREVCDYYRLIRNRFAHVEVNDQKLKNKNSRLRALLSVSDAYLPPKSYDDLDYGDFDLFTRAVKALGARICAEARPPDSVLIEFAKTGSFAALKRYRANPSRYREALCQKLQMDFGLDEQESSNIVGSVISGG